MKEKLNDLIGRVLGIPAGSVTDLTSPENTPAWDSFNAIMMVAELEKASGMSFSMSEIMSVKNVGDIRRLLEKHHVKAE